MSEQKKQLWLKLYTRTTHKKRGGTERKTTIGNHKDASVVSERTKLKAVREDVLTNKKQKHEPSF